MDLTIKTPKEELIDKINDLEIPEDVLYANNTFSLTALNETLERLSLINFWSLYQTQRARLHMERFDIPFRDFKPTYRLSGEKTREYFPKRNIAYIDYQFIRAELRKKYRNSDVYNKAVNQVEISENPSIFRYNHLVFINGDYISTTEVYPQEAKTGIIIDLESNQSRHGITYADYTRWMEENPTVTIIIVPNFKVSMLNTNQYIINRANGSLPFDNITGSEYFTDETVCFLNSGEGLSRRFLSDKITIDTESRVINFDNDLGAGGKTYHLCFITFDHLFAKRYFSNEHPYTQLSEAKMPCPKEHFVFLSRKTGIGSFQFDGDISADMYYPNIYKFNGLEDNEEGLALVFQDEDTVTKSEEYINDLKKYEEYIALLPRFEDGSIDDIIKNYRPSTFTYSIEDYEGSVYVPDTMNYKVQKLHKAIYNNPWALAVYMDMLNLPSDKFFLDMEKIDLTNRIRRDSSREEIDAGTPVVTFNEDRYVFAMNRHYVETRKYGFRIFIDGYFQLDNTYTILSGPNFYFIYIPVDKIKPTTMIEIERYKLYTIEKRGTVESIDTPVVEFDFSEDRQMFGYSREIYAVDLNTLLFIPKNKLRIEVLYKFNEKYDRWVEIPEQRNIPLENKVRVYVKDEAYVGKQIRAGIQRTTVMASGDVYHENPDDDDRSFWYTKGEISNFGGYDRSNYRVFNNGRLLLPIEYYINTSERYGKKDFFRTSCLLREGDRFTIDHVPAQFRAVYFQRTIDEENNRGFVDLDGKIALPISLKWYDIYVNGQKLNKKNIEIISPTKFYIQGVDSRINLLIVVKNRDTEIFHLPYYESSFDAPVQVDWNNTIIDELMDDIAGLKKIIDETKQPLPDNTPDIAESVALNIDALVFFFEYFMYTFINANKRQITQEIKEAFPSLLLDYGIMPIDSNDGCIDSNAIGGYLVKSIDCNIKKGEKDMFSDANIDYSGVGALQDRFAMRPLNTDNYKYALREEFMTDPNTAEPAIVNADGTVTSISTTVRLKHHIEDFNSKVITYGMGRADIYQITFDDEYKTNVYTPGENLLTETIVIPDRIGRLCLSIDATFLSQDGECKMLKLADIDPTITINYTADGVQKTITCKLTRLSENMIEENNRIVSLDSITITEIPETVKKSFVHSLLLAY